MLLGKRVEPAVADQVVTELIELGYLDDARYAARFAEDRRRLDGWGSERIARRLRELGVDREHIDAALADQDPEEEMEAALELLRRRCPAAAVDPRQERDRALGILIRRGYAPELAFDALRRHAGVEAEPETSERPAGPHRDRDRRRVDDAALIDARRDATSTSFEEAQRGRSCARWRPAAAARPHRGMAAARRRGAALGRRADHAPAARRGPPRGARAARRRPRAARGERRVAGAPRPASAPPSGAPPWRGSRTTGPAGAARRRQKLVERVLAPA